jgi:hypothetical protein
VIGFLHLVTGGKMLAEHAVFVAQPVAHHRQLQGGAAVEKAGGQTPQAAVTESGILLRFEQILHLQAEVVEGAAGGIVHAEVEHGIAQGSAHQKFEGEIVGAAAVLFLPGIAGLAPAFRQPVADGQGQRLENVVQGAAVAIAPQVMGVVVLEVVGDARGIHAQGRKFGQARHPDVALQRFIWHRLSFVLSIKG